MRDLLEVRGAARYYGLQLRALERTFAEELAVRVGCAFRLHLDVIADGGLWRVYPVCLSRYALARIRLFRLRLILHFNHDDEQVRALSRLIIAYTDTIPRWI